MSKRIKVYPPNGGEPIECYQEDSVRLVANGWTIKSPAVKPDDPAIETETKTDDEGLNDGNTKRKRRNR